MEGSKMSKTEYDLKAIIYSAYDTPHKLCDINENYTTTVRNLVGSSHNAFATKSPKTS